MGLFDRLQAQPAPASPQATGYDRVGVPGDGGSIRFLTKAAFGNLALVERVRLLSSGSVTFYRGEQQVDPSEALRG